MKKTDPLLITKANGAQVPFSKEKLRRSLLNSGANDEVADSIVEELQHTLYEGISTRKIYRKAFKLLKDRSRKLAAKYHLKSAIMELGPSGYIFEKFVSQILQHQGYAVKLGEIVQGKCVSHEIDVIAERNDHHIMIECKYHNQPGTVSDVKIPLYIQARFKDVEAAWLQIPGHHEKFHQGWVVTNTRFSEDAIKYGTCAGLLLLAWDFPKKNGLKDQIDKLGLYPITCLTTLTKVEKLNLLNMGIIFCNEIKQNQSRLQALGISSNRLQAILVESKQLYYEIKNNDTM
jgi:Holliday junction resolvase-like predicted endonuclease